VIYNYNAHVTKQRERERREREGEREQNIYVERKILKKGVYSKQEK